MLDKLKFNNLIISNKKPIQQGRIQVINKLVQKIRKLKELLEKYPDDEKNKERLRKNTENLAELKKLKRIEIMQSLLLLDKKPTSIITNGRATPSEIAIAMLALNQILQTQLKRFKDELNLSTATDESWKEEIMEVSKRRSKIQRTEEKRRQRKDQKEQKAIGRKRLEWIQEQKNGTLSEGEIKRDATEEEVQEPAVAADANETLPTAGVWQEEPLEMETSEIEPVVVKKITGNNKKIAMERKPKMKKTETKAKLNKAMAKKPKEPLEVTEKLTATVEKLVETAAEPEIRFEMDSESDENAEPEVTHIVDPFFITASGENYLTTAIVARNDAEESNENGGEERMHLGGGYRKDWDEQRKTQNEHRRSGGVGGNSYQSDFQNDNRRNGGKFQSNNSRRSNFQSDKRNFQTRKPETTARQPQIKRDPQKERTNTDETTRLHPSWAAKQKLKPVISSFQGKKTTFGDDNQVGGAPTKSRTPSVVKQAKNKSSNRAAPPAVAATETLHPSWVAKQKLKPNITAFVGKKTTFDD